MNSQISSPLCILYICKLALMINAARFNEAPGFFLSLLSAEISDPHSGL